MEQANLANLDRLALQEEVATRAPMGVLVTIPTVLHPLALVELAVLVALVVVAIVAVREMLVMETQDLVTQVYPEILVLMGLMAIQVLL